MSKTLIEICDCLWIENDIDVFGLNGFGYRYSNEYLIGNISTGLSIDKWLYSYAPISGAEPMYSDSSRSTITYPSNSRYVLPAFIQGEFGCSV